MLNTPTITLEEGRRLEALRLAIKLNGPKNTPAETILGEARKLEDYLKGFPPLVPVTPCAPRNDGNQQIDPNRYND